MDDKMKLTIEIKNQAPIELIDLAAGMLALGDEYRSYLSAHHRAIDAEGTRLYVKEVRTGSIITELVALAPYALPLVEHAESILEYGKWLGSAYDWLIGRGNKLGEAIPKTTLQNLSRIIEPVAKDRSSQFNLAGVTVNGDVHLNFSITSTEANAAQNAVRRELDLMKEPITGIHHQVVMYWAQARNQPNSKSGDRARIESIYRGDVKVVFANDEIKTRMLYDTPYPFNKAFIVDVAVETIEDKPILYKVIEMHDILDRETAD